MKRRFSTRTLGLSIRMGIALAGVAAIYAAILSIAVAGVLSHNVAATVAGLGLAAWTPFLLRRQWRGAAESVLRATRARPEPAGDALVPAAERLAAQAGVRAPDVIVTHSWAPNALVVETQGRPLLVVTTELLRRLEPKELDAVVAHEITHLANRDGAVMTFVGGPAFACAALWRERKELFLLWPLMGVLWLVALALMRSMSRYREFAADRGSALLTGAPEQLMSALQKIAGATPRGDLRGGAAISALCIVGTRRGFLPDHPPLEKRLARLAEMARELGRPLA